MKAQANGHGRETGHDDDARDNRAGEVSVLGGGHGGRIWRGRHRVETHDKAAVGFDMERTAGGRWKMTAGGGSVSLSTY
jgi:hypothetical protein